MMGVSFVLISKPKEWPENVAVTGLWILKTSSTYTPPPTLLQFLDAGPAPVCIGFSSAPVGDPAALSRTLVEALDRTGMRGVIVSGWGGIRADTSSDKIFVIEAVPFEWLFARAAAVITAGGTGTTSDALLAGVPQIIVPFTMEQHFWAARFHSLGLAPAPIPIEQLTSELLAEAIKTAITDPALQNRVREAQRSAGAENGVQNALDFIFRNMTST